jgi:hypothetical protein
MEETRAKLADAVTASLEQRSPTRLIRSVVFSVLATLALWLLLRAMSRAGKWLNARVSREVDRRTERLHLPPSAHSGQLNHMLRGTIRVVAIVLGLLLINVWLTFVLKQFPYTYPWGDQIDNYLFAALSSIGLAMLHSVPDLLMLALIFVIARFVTRWLGMLFDAVRAGRFTIPGVDEETALPAKRLTTLFLWVLTFALASPAAPAAGAKDVTFSRTLNEDVRAVAVSPDEVPANISLEMIAIRPDGTRTPLIRLNTRADWSRRYWFERPLPFPRGTRIEVAAKLDDPDILSAAFGGAPAVSQGATGPLRLTLNVVRANTKPSAP